MTAPATRPAPSLAPGVPVAPPAAPPAALPAASADDRRRRLLAACERLVLRDGARRLTLAAVAAEGGVDRATVRRHFPTREALGIALIEHLLDRFDARITAELEADRGAPEGRFTRAFVRASLLGYGDQQQEDAELSVSGGLLAGLGEQPGLLEPLIARTRIHQQRLEADGLPAARATVVRLAADGFYWSAMLGLAPPAAALRRAVLDDLLALAGAEPEAG